MEYNKTIRELKRLEKRSSKEGYNGDAAEYAFRRLCLEGIKQVVKQLKENSKQYKYLWQTLEEFKESEAVA